MGSTEPLLKASDLLEFEDEAWDVKALEAAMAARTGTGACSAIMDAVSCGCSKPRIPGGTDKYKMAYNVGNGIYRNARAQEKTWESPLPGAENIGDLWRKATKTYAHANCMGWREISSMTKDGVKEKYVLSPYQWITYGQAYKKANCFGKGLRSLGINQKDFVNFFADTKAEWQLACQGCFEYGITVATTYANLGKDALKYGINQSESKVLFTDADLVPIVASIIHECPTVKHVVFVSDPRPKSHPAHKSDEQVSGLISAPGVSVHSFEQVVQLGEANAGCEPGKVTIDELAMLMYTSGSTGNPKGVMITHRNLLAGVAGASDAITGMSKEDTYIAYLPLAHILEVIAENSCLSKGVSIGYGTTKTITDTSVCVEKGCKGDATELRPTIMAAVPMIMDKIRNGVTAKVNQTGGATKTLFETAYGAKALALKEGYDTPFWNKLVFDGLRKKLLGGRLRYCLSGGGPLSEETQLFMNIVFCCPIGQGWGLTETSGCGTTCWPNDRSVGRVGVPMTCVQIKLEDWPEGGYYAEAGKNHPNPRGEILIGGAMLSAGYYKMPEKTAETFVTDSDGNRWMKTGDVGEIHADGVLQIIDRKKDLIKLSGGEYVSLGKIEPIIRNSQYVDNAMVYVKSTVSYCVTIVTTPPGSDPVDQNVILKDIQRICKEAGCAKFEIPKKIFVAEEEWGPHNDLCTAALKLKRRNLEDFYRAKLIELTAEN